MRCGAHGACQLKYAEGVTWLLSPSISTPGAGVNPRSGGSFKVPGLWLLSLLMGSCREGGRRC